MDVVEHARKVAKVRFMREYNLLKCALSINDCDEAMQHMENLRERQNTILAACSDFDDFVLDNTPVHIDIDDILSDSEIYAHDIVVQFCEICEMFQQFIKSLSSHMSFKSAAIVRRDNIDTVSGNGRNNEQTVDPTVPLAIGVADKSGPTSHVGIAAGVTQSNITVRHPITFQHHPGTNFSTSSADSQIGTEKLQSTQVDVSTEVEVSLLSHEDETVVMPGNKKCIHGVGQDCVQVPSKHAESVIEDDARSHETFTFWTDSKVTLPAISANFFKCLKLFMLIVMTALLLTQAYQWDQAEICSDEDLDMKHSTTWISAESNSSFHYYGIYFCLCCLVAWWQDIT